MPTLYHASSSDHRASIEASGLQPNAGRLGDYVYATFTEGQARKIAEHYESNGRNKQDIWKIQVPKEAVQKVGEHPAWAGMSDFKEVCLSHVPSSQLTRVGGGGYSEETECFVARVGRLLEEWRGPWGPLQVDLARLWQDFRVEKGRGPVIGVWNASSLGSIIRFQRQRVQQRRQAAYNRLTVRLEHLLMQLTCFWCNQYWLSMPSPIDVSIRHDCSSPCHSIWLKL